MERSETCGETLLPSMMKAVALIALLLAVQGCRRGPGVWVQGSARRLHQDPISSSARASGWGTDTAGASGTGTVDGATKTTIGGALASGSGTQAQTEVEVSGNSGASSGSLLTGGSAQGANGASSTSIGSVDTKPAGAQVIAFTNGAGFGADAAVESATETSARSPWGTVTSSSKISVMSGIGAYGSTMGNSISGYGGLTSQSQAIGFNLEGRYGDALAIASTYGGYAPGAFSAATTATTEIDSTVARSAGTGVFSAPFGSTTVTVQDSARPNPVTLG